MLLYQTLAFSTHGKIKKNHTKIINLKYGLGREMKKLSYLMGHILYQIFDIILSIFLKTWRKDSKFSNKKICK